jgi:hypothetical protein
MSLSERLRPDVEAAPWVIAEVKKLEAEVKQLQEGEKERCVEFFRWWYNQPGTNTEQGYDRWVAECTPELIDGKLMCDEPGCTDAVKWGFRTKAGVLRRTCQKHWQEFRG